MPDFRRTLPLPPPGRTVGEAFEEGAHQHARKIAPAPSGANRSRPGRQSMAPGRPTPGSRRLRSAICDARNPGRKTPPPARAESEARAVPLRRSDPLGAQGARSLERARRSAALGKRIRRRPQLHRASLRSVEPRRRVRPAPCSRGAPRPPRARSDTRTSRAALEAAYVDGARVLHLGLPSALRRRVPMEVTVDLSATCGAKQTAGSRWSRQRCCWSGGPTPRAPARPKRFDKRWKSIRRRARATSGRDLVHDYALNDATACSVAFRTSFISFTNSMTFWNICRASLASSANLSRAILLASPRDS